MGGAGGDGGGGERGLVGGWVRAGVEVAGWVEVGLGLEWEWGGSGG